MKSKLIILLINAISFSAGAVNLTIINHTGAPARIAHLFNVCQGNIVPHESPIALADGESKTFQVLLVMQHYKICGSGFCNSSSLQMKTETDFTLEMTLNSDVIHGIANPEEWGGPSNPCP